MTGTHDAHERAEHHATKAERLLKSWWLSTHVKAQVHATLAVYYSRRAQQAGREVTRDT